MIFDTVDFEFLRLTGFCRYMPSGICRKYDTPMFKRSVISNLKLHRLIKLMNDKMSYKLTKKGRDCLREMGMTFAKDARTDLKKASYQRKLKNAQWNVLLTLAGIDVYYDNARKLATADCGYLSSLLLRADNMVRVLSGARFFGILKIADTVYVPYYVENEQSWIYPKFEREIYQSQTDSMKNVKDIKLILIGESLEELWGHLNPAGEPRESGKGMKPFKKALEELACEYLLVPFGRDGVMQMSVMKIFRYRQRLAKAIGCKDTTNLSECDGIIDGVPHIIAIDCNVKRLIPDFKDYVLSECEKRGILVPLKVLSSGTRFDAYQLELRNDEQDIEAIVNDGLKTGLISIPNSVPVKEIGNVETVSQYLNRYGTTIATRIRDSFNPLFDPASENICDRLKRINGYIKKNVGYSLYPAQLAVAESLKRRLDRAKVGLVVAECGSGKTKIGSVALAVHQDGRKTFNVILSPSHVTKKWVREIEESLPDTTAEVVYSIADIKNAYADYQNGKKSKYIVLSKERARDGYMRRPAVIYSKVKKGFVCPWCGEVVTMEIKRDDVCYTVNANQYFFKKRNTQNHCCSNPECKKPLWTVLNPYDMKLEHNKWVKIGGYGFVYRDFADRHLKKTNDAKVIAKINEIVDNPEQIFMARGAHRRYSMSGYIAEHIKNIDGLIADELHLFKGDSGQGDAMETLIGCSRKVIGMTATLINGYSSGLFYLLYRIVPHLMKADNKDYETPQRFNDEYGVTEMTYEVEESEYNENSKSKKKLTHSRQRPGVSPLVYSRFLMDCAVFLSLNDMGKHLPEYEEIPVELNLRDDIAEEYERIEDAYRNVMRVKNMQSRRLMSKFMSLLTTYSDQPYDAEPIMFPDSEIPVVEPKSLSSFDELHEKDTATLDIVKRKVDNGEKVLIYTSWVKIDTQEKLKKLLEDNGYRVAVLPQTVAPEKREQWVDKKIKAGLDVLITNPSLIETGLDLNAFTTLIYYNIGYNLYTFRQSSRRSWRINQTAPRIEVYILYYKDVMQARAIRLMASKLAAATLVEGNFTDEGLAALGDDADMTSQLAKELTMGIRNEVEDVAEMFKRMAVIKDEDEPEENMSEYIITDEVQIPGIAKAISVADKLERARLLAKQARGIKESGTVKQIQFGYEGNQMTLFDVA